MFVCLSLRFCVSTCVCVPPPHWQVKLRIVTCGLMARLGEDHCFPSVHEGVRFIVREYDEHQSGKTPTVVTVTPKATDPKDDSGVDRAISWTRTGKKTPEPEARMDTELLSDVAVVDVTALVPEEK